MSRIAARGTWVGLRPFEDDLNDEEIARVYRWSTDPQVLRWSGGAPSDLTLAGFRDRLISERAYVPVNRQAFLIVTLATRASPAPEAQPTQDGNLIGRIGIFAIDWQNKKGELGIVIGEAELWGQGYGRDAVTTLLRYVFETTLLERINLFTFDENLRAQRCFAACGFRVLGRMRRISPDVGEFDGVEMEITRREFFDLAQSSRIPIPLSQDEK